MGSRKQKQKVSPLPPSQPSGSFSHTICPKMVSEKAQGKICSGTRGQEWQLRHPCPLLEGASAAGIRGASGSSCHQIGQGGACVVTHLAASSNKTVRMPLSLSLYLRARLLMASAQVSWSWGECDPEPREASSQSQPNPAASLPCCQGRRGTSPHPGHQPPSPR